jgi:hypothetical protein
VSFSRQRRPTLAAEFGTGHVPLGCCSTSRRLTVNSIHF